MVADRESHRTVVLRVRGLPPLSYICGHLLMDVGTLSLPLIALSVGLIYLFDCQWLMGVRLIGFVFVAIVSTIGTASLGYAFSHCFASSSMAGRIIPAGLPAVTVIPFVVIFVLTNQQTIDMLSTLFCICPPYALQEGVKRLMELSGNGGAPTLLQVMTTLREPVLLSSAFTVVALSYVCMKEGVSCCRTTASRQQTTATARTFHAENTLSLHNNDNDNNDNSDNGDNSTTAARDSDDGAATTTHDSAAVGLRVEFMDAMDENENYESKNGHDDDDTFCVMSRGKSLQTSSSHPSHRVHHSYNWQRTFSDSSTNGIRCRKLIKEFPTTKKSNDPHKQVPEVVRAVNGLSLEVRRGELVGFLGPNGAGKSTTMSILSTEILSTYGEVRVAGFDVSNTVERNVVRSSAILGYCPQFDALFESLTVLEHFVLWGVVQGENENEAAALGKELASAVGLTQYLQVHADNLSGGCKRKLSIALALLGSPDVLLLDEPSTGVDVASRRVVWNVLKQFRQQAAVLLSTHSMEEAVAISDRIAIVVKGKVAADGTVAELQQKYGDGFVLEVAAELNQGDVVEKMVVEGVLQGRLKERFDLNLKFTLDPNVVALADAFETMAQMESVKFFSISHATMEDVFINCCVEKNRHALVHE